MFDFNGENLQVGDKVIVYASYFSSKSYYVGTVVKRTPTGLLDIEWGNGKKERFKSNGYEYHRSSGYGRTSLYLEPYTEERGKQVIQENKRKCMVGWLKEFDYTKLSYEEAETKEKEWGWKKDPYIYPRSFYSPVGYTPWDPWGRRL